MKSVVLLSGGIDSATCLAIEVDRWSKNNVKAVAFNYGQKHSVELDHAQKVADFYQVPLTILTVE